MKKMKFKLSLLICVAVFFVPCSSAMAATYLSLGTGGVTGVYYPLGGAIANIITNKIDGYNCTAESTGGAVENVMLISKNNIDIGFVDATSAYNAQNKLGSFADEDVKNLRGVVSIYLEAVQIVTLDSALKVIPDLRNKRVAVGSPGSGTETMAKDIFALYGMDYNDINEDFLGFGDASAGLKDNTVDAAFIWAGVPTSGIMELGTQHKVSILNFSDEMVEKLKEFRPFCVPMKITKQHYSSLQEEVKTIAIPATLQCRANLPDEFVYNFLTALFDNLDVIAGAHVRGGDLSLATALDGMEKIELHPGAVKFYKEKGLLK
ncbi:C4-dicarboxylate ABC transporter substrate-binding protein [Synergistales bacterium]|nr:C4-dicarboxylate ABC transporter substrate-binding protein [Synergistales bacterium]